MKLQMCSSSTKGIWIDFLCFMYWEKSSGVLEGTYDELRSLARATKGDFDFFLVEAERHKFCDISRTCRNLSTDVTDEIRIINRRINREEKKKEYDRLRKRKERGVRENSDTCPEVVKRHSISNSISNSISSNKNNAEADKSVLLNSQHWTTKIGEQLNKIEPIRNSLCELVKKRNIDFKVDQFIQRQIKDHIHPKAILLALQGLLKKATSKDPPDSYFGYAKGIIKIQNGNVINDEKQEAHEFYKTMEISGEMKKFLAGLIKGVE